MDFHLIFMERDQIWVIYHFDQIRQIDRLISIYNKNKFATHCKITHDIKWFDYPGYASHSSTALITCYVSINEFLMSEVLWYSSLIFSAIVYHPQPSSGWCPGPHSRPTESRSTCISVAVPRHTLFLPSSSCISNIQSRKYIKLCKPHLTTKWPLTV